MGVEFSDRRPLIDPVTLGALAVAGSLSAVAAGLFARLRSRDAHRQQALDDIARFLDFAPGIADAMGNLCGCPATLARVGTPASLPLLEQLRRGDSTEAARHAIDAIMIRAGGDHTGAVSLASVPEWSGAVSTVEES